MAEAASPSNRAHDFARRAGSRLSDLRRALPYAAIFAALTVAAAACGGSSNASAKSNPTAASSSSNTALDSYVAAVCGAAAQFEKDAAGGFGPGFGGGSGTQATGTPAAGVPGGRRGGIASKLAQPAATFVAAVSAANAPAELKAYNDQLVSQLNQIVSDIQNGTPVGGPPAGGPPASRTPRTGSQVPPQGSGTPRGGGPGGGVLGVFFRALPTPPAQVSAALSQAVAANTDCQSTGFTFGTGQ
jgi:hypothetical protein